jgi:hypothetical protein
MLKVTSVVYKVQIYVPFRATNAAYGAIQRSRNTRSPAGLRPTHIKLLLTRVYGEFHPCFQEIARFQHGREVLVVKWDVEHCAVRFPYNNKGSHEICFCFMPGAQRCICLSTRNGKWHLFWGERTLHSMYVKSSIYNG